MARISLGKKHRSFLAANIVSIGSGTTYIYSLYAPQLLEQCNIPVSSASSVAFNLTIGFSLLGFFAGQIVDRNINAACICASLAVTSAYTLLFLVYLYRISQLWILASALITLGFGNSLGFLAAIRCCNTNFVSNKGLAISFPISMAALAGILFSWIFNVWFEDNIAGFFKFLALVCPVLQLTGSFFITLIPSSGTTTIASQISNHDKNSDIKEFNMEKSNEGNKSVLDRLFTRSLIENIKSPYFLKYFFILNILKGLSQMYIYSIGTIIFIQLSSSNSPEALEQAKRIQAIQVSTIAFFNFLGRLSAGFISDFIVKSMKAQRMWNIVLASIIALLACFKLINNDPLLLLNLQDNPIVFAHFISTYLSFTSAMFGLAFGIVLGTFPTIVAETFPGNNYTTIWALLSSGGVLTVKLFTSLFSSNVGSNTLSADVICNSGSSCYQDSFMIMKILCFVTLIGTLLLIYSNRKKPGLHY